MSVLGAGPGFSLDIGTRKVVGLLTEPTRSGMRIVAAERAEHQVRSMYDGQVHDVAAVAAVVQAVKTKLERRTGLQLREAAVAAAGRSLRTFRGQNQRDFGQMQELTTNLITALELEAVQDAQRGLMETLRREGSGYEYHYMGHSVLSRVVDGQQLASLCGQRAQAVSLDVIATFLPRSVLDSLIAVLERVGLALTALTLEPIAAIGAVVPPTMRHLHLALVDIGAGTADVAVTERGAVIGYDMVPVAGDEITEAVSEAFLLEFPVAERVKRAAGMVETVTFTNILGQEQCVRSADLCAAIAPAVVRLANTIAERIMALSERAPAAVLLVGGGSLTPGLNQALGAALGLPPERIGVRGREAVRAVSGARGRLSGPDAITPIGIALGALQHPVGFAYVYVNGAGIRLFNPARLTVADALLAANVDLRLLQPRPGKGLTLWVNGQLKLVPGHPGQPGCLQLNGRPCGLDSPLHHRDHLQVDYAVPGADGRATVADLSPWTWATTVLVDGQAYPVPPLVRVNEQAYALDDVLQDNDHLEVSPRRTVAELVSALDLGDDAWDRYQPYLNGEPVGAGATVPAAAQLELRPFDLIQTDLHPMADAPDHRPPGRTDLARTAYPAGRIAIRVSVNGQLMECKPPPGWQSRVEGGTGHPSLIFAHLLPKVPLVQMPPPGRNRLVMAVNGQPAEFSTPVADGDEVQIAWE